MLRAAATGATEMQWQVSSDGVNFSAIAGATSPTYSFPAQAGQNGCESGGHQATRGPNSLRR
jgi:hypothetical protein